MEVLKKETIRDRKQIYSIRKNKAYGASSVLIGIMGSVFLLGGLAPAVQAEETDAKPETKPVNSPNSSGTSNPTVETNHLIITSSQSNASEPKPETKPELKEDNASTNETKPLDSTPAQPKEETVAPVKSTGGAKPTESGTAEAKPVEETTPSKRAVSIVYKVRYVDRKSHKVVHEVTKTKTVETTESKAKVIVTEIGAELANDSQLENYYVPDGNPTTMTKEIVEGADNVFVYEVEGFGETETPKERTVALKYTVEYVDGKSGLVLANEEKEEKVSTTETVAKKEVTIQPSLAANEKLKDWVLSDGAPASQKLTLTEGTVGKVTVKLQKSEPGKVRNKRKVQTPIVDGQPYLTLENQTKDYINRENMTFAGNGKHTYDIVYKIGASNLPNNDMNELTMTQGAKDLGFTLDTTSGTLTATLTPTRSMKGTYEVGFYVKSRPEVKVSGTIEITAINRYGFMIMNDQTNDKVPYFRNEKDTRTIEATVGGNYGSIYHQDRLTSPFYRTNSGDNSYLSDYVENNFPKTEVTINGLRIPSTPFGYFMDDRNKTVKDADEFTERYYTMLPIFAPMDRSIDFANNDKQGLSITKFTVLEASDGVEAKLIDLRHDKAPDKGVYRNNTNFQTVLQFLALQSYDYTNTPYYLQFTKLPKLPGNYFATVEITDNLGLTKKIRLNFTTYENSVSGNRAYGGESYALTTADALFEANKEYVDEKDGTVAIPTSNKEQILGKVVLNKDNAYIKSDVFPAGLELRAVEGKVDGNGNPTEAYVVKKEGVKVQPGVYSFSVKAHDGHYQDGGSRSFDIKIVDAINPIADQHWREGSVPTPIPVSMENGSKITGIRVEASGGYAVFEGNPTDSNISVYGLRQTAETQKARVYVTFKDGAGKTHTTFTDFNYVIDPNPVKGLDVEVTNNGQVISEGDSLKDMVITTNPSEGVTIKVDKTKLPKGTRIVDNIVDGVVVGKKIVGKGLYEGVYEIPILAVKGDVVRSIVASLTVNAREFVVPPETSEVEVFSNDIKAVTTGENGETVRTAIPRYGLQNIPNDAKVIYRKISWENGGLWISEDGTEFVGTPRVVGTYIFNADVSWRASNGVTRNATTTYKIIVTGLEPSLTVSSPTQPTDAYTTKENRLIAPLGSPIPTITIKYGPHSQLNVENNQLPEGLSYSYNQETHTATITGTPTKLRYVGEPAYPVRVYTELESGAGKEGVPRSIEKTIYIQVAPVTSGLEIDNADQTFNANEKMTPITVSGFDSRADIELDNTAPAGVTYNSTLHRIEGTPSAGAGTYTFNVKAIMPGTLGGQVTRKEVTLHVLPIEPRLSADPSSTTVVATNRIPDITITKDPLSELAVPTVTIGGTGDPKPLSELGLSYDATSRTITGTPTVVGSHTIHLSTTLSQRYTGVDGGVSKTLDIPVTVNAKSFDLNITNQTQTKTVLSPIDLVTLTVPEGVNLTVDTGALPPGVTYNAESKRIEGTPSRVGTYNITVTARPNGITGNDKTATVTIQVDKLNATIGITNKEQTVQVGTAINDVTVTSSEHANIYGIDALLSAVSGNNSGIVEANIANYFLGAYGLTYNATNHTITGTPTKTGRIVFTFIARTSENLGAAEVRETVVLNVVESLSKIPVITEVREGSSVVKGTGIAGATVTVTLPNGDEKTALVSGDGSWSVDTTSPLGKGQSISARQKEVNKTMSNDISATVVANAGLELSKEPIVEAIIEGATTITGKGENGSTINVTLPNGTVKTTTVTDGRWAVTLESPVVKGDNILVSQTQPNKATSPSVSATVVPTITKGDKGEDGAAGRDGISPEVSIVEDSEGNHVITITQPGKTPITTKVKNGRDGRTPKVAITPIYEDSTQPRTRRARSVDSQPTRKQIGIHITVYYDNNNSGSYDNGDEVISEEDIYDGLDGNNGQDGKDILSGTSDPTSETGKEGDKYVNTTTGDIFVKKNGQWEREGNLKGPKGDKGEDGAAGAAGQNGRDGKDILSGTTDPAIETGKDGDKYVNTTTGDIFVKKNGHWEREGTLKGPKGDKGEDGATGAAGQNGRDGQNGQNGRDGKDILSGTSDPISETGKEGDKYVNTTTGDIFVKKNGQWEREGNLKGPKGDKGEDGATGAAGQNGRDGKDILSGTSDPTSETGKEGDKYVNTTTGDIFIKKNGQWEREGNLKGPKGDKGDTPTITTQPGADGISTDIILTLPGKEPITVNVKNGTNGRDGLNGKSLVVKKEGNETKIYVEDPANPGQPLDATKPLATILDGLKGDKGEAGTNGVDGKSPVITMTDNGDGTHSIIVRNPDGSESTTKVKDGKDGKTATITTTENPDGSHTITVINPDGASKEIVVRDGKTPKLEVIDNGNGTHTVKVTDGDGNVTNTIIKDGKDGKSATATTTENPDGSHTVTITNPDGTTNNFIVKNGRDGVDGRTPTATVRNNNDGSHTIVITNPDGVTTETTIRDGQSPKITITDEQNGTHKITVLNGDGTTTETIIKDGKSPVTTVTDNHDGTYTIRVDNGNGTVSETTVRDGKSPTAKVVNNGDGTHTVTIVNSDGTTTTTIVRDGQSPKLEVIDNHNGSHTIKVIGSDGKETSTTIFDGKSPTAKIVDNGDGTHTLIIVDSNGQQYTSIIRDGKDGKDGKSPTATVRNNNDGTHTITIINPDGSKTETIIKDGKDGKSPEVTVEDNGNGTYTITIINVNGIVYKTIIRDGKCGCNDKPGGHTPENPTTPKPENPTTPGGPTFAMPAPPVHEKPEFKGGVPGMPAVHEKPEYPGIPTNPSSDETTPGTPTPGTSMNPNPGVPTPGTSMNPNPGVSTPGTSTNPTPVEPTSGESTNPNSGEPTSVDSTNQNSGVPTSEGLTPSNPGKSSAVNEHLGSELPKTGTKVEYLPMLLGSGALLTLYIGRRKEEEE